MIIIAIRCAVVTVIVFPSDWKGLETESGQGVHFIKHFYEKL